MKSFLYSIINYSPWVFDVEAMLTSLEKNILHKVAIDAMGIQTGDVYDPYYKKLTTYPRLYVTPHIAYNTEVTDEVSNKIMIENIEAWLNKKPKNLIN